MKMAYENSEPEWAGPGPPRRSLILCFDGTGNKFQGDSGDSNSKEGVASVLVDKSLQIKS